MSEKKYFVSVIIPVHNDFEALDKCLSSLRIQTYPLNMFEIIVVDNNSTDSSDDIQKKFSEVKFLSEKTPGSYIARNKGILHSKGEILAFIDSDCIAHKDWIKNGVKKLLNEKNCGIVGGKVKLIYKNYPNLNIVEIYEKHIAFRQKDYVQLNKFSGAGNLFTFKKVLEKTGKFNHNLFSAGDMEFGQRVYSHGYNIVYGNNVIVYHPARYSFFQIYRKTIRVTGGYYNVMKERKKNFILHEIIKNLKFPLYILNRNFYDKKVGFKERLKVIIIVLLSRYISIFENIRLYFQNNAKNY